MPEISKNYEAKTIEPKWYKFWEESFFKADPFSSKPAYCLVIPPPNVTGVLHMGHALVNTLQDILVRWKRMSGFEVLWVPGTDHAGIATQTVVERFLIRTEGKRRKDYTREEFLKHVWLWKDKSEKSILEQLKRLGSSCDWSRLRFTMDEGNNCAVRTLFKKMFDEKLIYRGDYLVNWDPVTQTALADDEVEYEERQSFLWSIRYPFTDGSGFITIATTRPETLLGDTAVAVSPNDSRYKDHIGKMIDLPLTNRSIPLIADPHVDPKFGTGAVKVTPAHDSNDYQIGLAHDLLFLNIMTPDGKINEQGGPFAGLSMSDAREAIVKALKEKNFLEKIEPHVNRVGISYRSKATIEPYLSKQWFIRMEGFAKQLQEIIKKEKTQLTPKNWESTYFHWVDHLRDWCISRQLWWGHRIPIWYHREDPSRMLCEALLDEPEEVKNHPKDWIQDSDVLDTWFSSALWPFSTLGWPNQTADFAKFYPNATLITGHDILFFWVARMLAMGQYATGQVPFPQCFLHGLIYGKSYWRQDPKGGIVYAGEQERLEYDLGKPLPLDVFSKWEKMSKSKGNIIDPLELIESYGTDAVRMALCASATHARQIDLDRRRFEEFKNFTNKIWNGSRFVLMHLEENLEQNLSALTSTLFAEGLDETLFVLEDKWILSRLTQTVKRVQLHLENYAFDQAALEAYDFFWKEFCAFYVEISKPILFGKKGTIKQRLNKQKLLVIVLCQVLRLMHPMAPFITEELFHLLQEFLPPLNASLSCDVYTKECIYALQQKACIVAPYPQVLREADHDLQVESHFALMEQVIYTIRNMRGEMKLSPGTETSVYISGEKEDPEWQVVQANQEMISALVRVKEIKIETEMPFLGFASTAMFHALKIMIPLPAELIKQEKERLNKEIEKLDLTLLKLRSQLANEDFVIKAPPALIDKQRQQLLQGEQEREEMLSKIKKWKEFKE